MAGLLPAMGTLGDRLGHKKIFTLGLLVFSVASLAAAFSPVPASAGHEQNSSSRRCLHDDASDIVDYQSYVYE